MTVVNNVEQDVNVWKSRPPRGFHVMIKPRGSICNLNCAYCYFLSKEHLYPESAFRMSDEVLEELTRQYVQAQRVPEVTFGWQGGEPTLMGLDFFRRAVAYQKKYAGRGMRVHNAIQTNGTLLDDEWGAFFAEEGFLVGLSMDGPPSVHNVYRHDKAGKPTHERVMVGARVLQKHGVEFNILATVHAGNAEHPLDVYRFFRDEVGATGKWPDGRDGTFIQFIPIVERDNETGFQEGEELTVRSVGGRQYGEFLSAIFDEWVRKDVGTISVQIFDVSLGAWLGQGAGLCVFEPTCGLAMAMEHNGDLYACDHFVEPRHLLGNIMEVPLMDMVTSDHMWEFGQNKLKELPQYCLDCEVRFICHGACPKNRVAHTPDGEPGLNALCEGYRHFFNHIDEPMRMMANELRAQRPPANVMMMMAQKDSALERAFENAGRNDPCPCGSGKKFKHCHGRH